MATKFTSLLDLPSVVHEGESYLKRVLIQIWVPLVYMMLCFILAMTLVFYIDTTRFRPGHWDPVKFSDLFTQFCLRASNVTTLVSFTFVLIRIVGQSFIISAVWRCAITLLQHDGLSLGQLDSMLSHRIPTSFSGKYSLPIAMALLMMLPSAFIAPILSGTVDSEGAVHQSTILAGFGSSVSPRSDDYWERFKSSADVRRGVVLEALAYGSALWADIRRQDKEAGINGHRYRYVPDHNNDTVVGTIVEQVPMPYIQVKSLTWDQQLTPEIKDILGNSTRRFLEHFMPGD